MDIDKKYYRRFFKYIEKNYPEKYYSLYSEFVAMKKNQASSSHTNEPPSLIPTDDASDIEVKATCSRGESAPVFDAGILPPSSTTREDNGCKAVRSKSAKKKAAKAPSLPVSPRPVELPSTNPTDHASNMNVKATSSRGESVPFFEAGILPPSSTTGEGNGCKTVRSKSTKKKPAKAPLLPLSSIWKPPSPIPTNAASDMEVKATSSRGKSAPVFDAGTLPPSSTSEEYNGCKTVQSKSAKKKAVKTTSLPLSPRQSSRPASGTPSSPVRSSSPGHTHKTAPSNSTEQSAPSALLVSSERRVVHSPITEGPDRVKPPPLFIRDTGKWFAVSSLMMDQKIIFTARSTALGIRVKTATSLDHRRLTRLLRNRDFEYHTYALEDERHLSVVICGLPVCLSTDSIFEDLKSQSLPVLSVHRMFQTTTKVPMESVLVHLERSEEGEKIFNIQVVRGLSGLRVKVSRGRGVPGQCHRCQMYGHSKRFCNARPRCVKCLDDHATADCPRKGLLSKDPPSCVLCQQKGHPANYRGCPKAPRKTQPEKNPERRPSRRVKLP